MALISGTILAGSALAGLGSGILGSETAGAGDVFRGAQNIVETVRQSKLLTPIAIPMEFGVGIGGFLTGLRKDAETFGQAGQEIAKKGVSGVVADWIQKGFEQGAGNIVDEATKPFTETVTKAGEGVTQIFKFPQQISDFKIPEIRFPEIGGMDGQPITINIEKMAEGMPGLPQISMPSAAKDESQLPLLLMMGLGVGAVILAVKS